MSNQHMNTTEAIASKRRTSALTEIDYMAAVGLMVLTGKGSTSFIQRTLGLGYNAAAGLVERMEADGVLAKPDHAGKREVLLQIPVLKVLL